MGLRTPIAEIADIANIADITDIANIADITDIANIADILQQKSQLSQNYSNERLKTAISAIFVMGFLPV